MGGAYEVRRARKRERLVVGYDIQKINERINAMKSVCAEGKREIRELVEAIVGVEITPPSRERWFAAKEHFTKCFFHLKADGTGEWFHFNGTVERSMFTVKDAEYCVATSQWVEIPVFRLTILRDDEEVVKKGVQ